ncbi:Thiamine biosynthesis lipoprotein apbE [Proteiniborus sp. DW1]|uniref:FAD:protein FMN transferase n=1 Tax=Proteiniborus sp. DW1 TaxID=1889883 RepID=UPI00092E17AC|nr:FAD:protein FMN transferase [Proteiniborus sp. DW1]SCG83972.1 Thiamine biosynthesis lipoprotein apbE [Proteiniborus sp. DW1]
MKKNRKMTIIKNEEESNIEYKGNGKTKKFIVYILSIIVIAIGMYSIISKYKGANLSKDSLIKEKTGFLLGTVVQIKFPESQPVRLFDDVFVLLKEIENDMSINIEDSEVIRINKSAGKSYVKVSPETYYVIERGKYYSELSEGRFDISIGPLVKLWGIGTNAPKVPTQVEIEKELSKVDYTNILLNESDKSIMLAKEGMIIDLGGIAKGYAADVVADYLKSKDIHNAIIDLGGNILALGGNGKADFWNIGLQNPFEARNKHLGILKVKDKTIVTSGVYERNFTEKGKTYHHILDPFTGYPVENSLMSVSIIADKSIDADGLSTTVFALGLEKGAEIIKSLDGVDAIFVDKAKNVYITEDIKNSLTITNDEFTVKDI